MDTITNLASKAESARDLIAQIQSIKQTARANAFKEILAERLKAPQKLDEISSACSMNEPEQLEEIQSVLQLMAEAKENPDLLAARFSQTRLLQLYLHILMDSDSKKPAAEESFEKRLTSELREYFLERERGFMFSAMQERIRLDQTEQIIDLVFYCKPLHAYLLIVLKTACSGFKEWKEARNGLKEALESYADKVNDFEDREPIGLLIDLDKEAERFCVEYVMNNPSLSDLEPHNLLPEKEELLALIAWTYQDWKKERKMASYAKKKDAEPAKAAAYENARQ